MYQELLATASLAARAGAQTLRQLWNQAVEVEPKARFDFVTEADRASEQAILELIRRRHPHHAVLAEESAPSRRPPQDLSGVLWVVDPLDGTTNFIHRFPHLAVSVAALVDGRPAVGVIIDVTRGEEFAACAGAGVTLNGRPVRVSPQQDPARALLLTGFPFRDKDRLPTYLQLFQELFLKVSGIRRAGAAALDLAYVAAGRAEGFWELGLKPWDLAAGILMVQEAGGVVSDFHGGPHALWHGDVVAANPHLHPLIQTTCARYF